MKLAGLDLNGVYDRAARNWFGEATETRDAVHVFDGGLSSVAVETAAPENRSGASASAASTAFVAGPQARLAPHGRGPGWGPVGACEKRVSLRRALDRMVTCGESEGRDRAAITAAIDNLARAADIAVLAIPDDGGFGEDAQARLLEAASRTPIRRTELLWRPVAVCLAVLDQQTMRRMAREASRVAVVSSVSTGLEIAVLRIVEAPWRGRTIAAPERREAGRALEWPASFARRLDAARAAVAEANPAVAREDIDWQAEMPHRLAAGLPAEPELVRNELGRWQALKEPEHWTTEPADFPEQARAKLADADVVIVESPLGSAVRSQLKAGPRAMAPNARRLSAPADAVARGALDAARRLARNEPPYFDFLPRIEVTAIGADGRAAFRDLFPPGEVVPGGRTFRAKEPPRYAVRKGQTALEIHIAKENQSTLKRWSAAIDPPEETVEVTLRCEQQPARGRARIEIASDTWEPLRARPVRLDWDALDDEPRDRDELLEELNRDAGGFPARLIHPAHAAHWRRARGGNDLFSALEAVARGSSRFDGTHGQRLFRLVDALRTTSLPPGTTTAVPGERHYPIDTDGDLPADLSPREEAEAERLLEDALARIAKDLVRYLEAGKPPTFPPSHLFLPATWTFLRCPKGIRELLSAAVAADGGASRSASRAARLLAGKGAATALYHGVGRTLADPEEIAPVMDAILTRDRDRPKQYRLACLASLLSRRDAAARVLAERRDRLDRAVEVAINAAARFTDGTMQRGYFLYALQLAGGICRVRMTDTDAFRPTGESARGLAKALSSAREKRPVDPRVQDLTNEVIAFVEGHGTNPNLLGALENEAER